MFNKKGILTIPNLLSLLRLLMIPVIIWLYCVKENYFGAISVLILSGITDIADGYIARKFNMVSDFGKILDPVADKATQGCLLFCLMVKYSLVLPVVILFFIREITMILMGYMIIRRNNSVHSARWYGKANTVMVYSTAFLLILFPNIPTAIANTLLCLCGLTMAASLILYAIFYRKQLKNE